MIALPPLVVKKTIPVVFCSFIAVFGMSCLLGCLRTRAEIQEESDQKKEMHSQLTHLQASAAREAMRFEEFDSQFRQLNGRIEQLEHQLEQNKTQKEELRISTEQEKSQLSEKLKAFEESLRALEKQMADVNQELEALKVEREAAKLSQQKGSPKGSEKGQYKLAEDAFTKKEWKSAIVGYQKYREANPQGKHYASATYKIGMCFRELGMNADALPFFTEVVEKYPKSSEAKEAKTYLKGKTSNK